MKKWGIVLIVLVVGVWATTATAVRIDALPGPLGGFTHHEWGILLSGFAGSGASVLIAYFALRRTIRTMREQIAAGALEAAREREIEARSELLELLSNYSSIAFRHREDDDDALAVLDRKITICLLKWRINVGSGDDPQLRSELLEWRGLLRSIRESADWRYPYFTEGYDELSKCIEVLEGVAGNHREVTDGTAWTDAYSARCLRDVRVSAEKFVAELQEELQRHIRRLAALSSIRTLHAATPRDSAPMIPRSREFGGQTLLPACFTWSRLGPVIT